MRKDVSQIQKTKHADKYKVHTYTHHGELQNTKTQRKIRDAASRRGPRACSNGLAGAGGTPPPPQHRSRTRRPPRRAPSPRRPLGPSFHSQVWTREKRTPSAAAPSPTDGGIDPNRHRWARGATRWGLSTGRGLSRPTRVSVEAPASGPHDATAEGPPKGSLGGTEVARGALIQPDSRPSKNRAGHGLRRDRVRTERGGSRPPTSRGGQSQETPAPPAPRSWTSSFQAAGENEVCLNHLVGALRHGGPGKLTPHARAQAKP